MLRNDSLAVPADSARDGADVVAGVSDATEREDETLVEEGVDTIDVSNVDAALVVAVAAVVGVWTAATVDDVNGASETTDVAEELSIEDEDVAWVEDDSTTADEDAA